MIIKVRWILYFTQIQNSKNSIKWEVLLQFLPSWQSQQSPWWQAAPTLYITEILLTPATVQVSRSMSFTNSAKPETPWLSVGLSKTTVASSQSTWSTTIPTSRMKKTSNSSSDQATPRMSLLGQEKPTVASSRTNLSSSSMTPL